MSLIKDKMGMTGEIQPIAPIQQSFLTHRGIFIAPVPPNPRAQDDQYFLDYIILHSRNNEVHDIDKVTL